MPLSVELIPGTEARVMVGTRGFCTWHPAVLFPCSAKRDTHKPPPGSSWVEGEGVPGPGPLLCWRWGLHALEHERCPVLGKQRAACVHKVAGGGVGRGQMEEGVPG